MAGVCGDNRFEIIAKVKEHLLKATNIKIHPEELKQADNILFRLWQLGYFNQSELEKENAKLKVDNAFLENAFKDGAEFGYNKANEWHYVKDEDTPKIEGHYLVCLRNKDKDVFDCWIYYDKDVGWYSLKVRMKDIYAWKKIVLPKEIEK